jgi:pimeloyl-ACP methyl ester carboxylesterase
MAIDAQATGLCASCQHLRSVRSARGSDFVLCALSRVDPRFPKYPGLPVRQCSGYVPSVIHRTLTTNGIQLHVAEQGEGPLVLLLHGFPESWYSWRHQLPALAAAGYRVVAPDQRGYGASDKPHAIDAYDQVTLAADVAGLIDVLGEKQAVVIGHDWGSQVAWHTALLHPDRVRAVCGMSVPYGGRGSSSALGRMREVFKDNFFYILYFQEPGVAEAELEADVRKLLRMFYYSASGDAPPRSAFSLQKSSATLAASMADTDVLPAWLSEADLDYFTAQFEQSGFRGPINWYRNFDRTWERTAQLADKKIEQPALFVAGERDPVLAWSPQALPRMRELIPNLRETLIVPGTGHWVQQERPEEVNAALLRFLGQVN